MTRDDKMKIDELITAAELRDIKCKKMPIKIVDEYLNSIALAALKAHKAGYQMFTYDYSERDWLPAECELTRLFEELSDESK